MSSIKANASRSEFMEILPVAAGLIVILSSVRVFSRAAAAVNDKHVMLKAAYMEQMCSSGQNGVASPDQADAASMAPSRLAGCTKEECVRSIKPQKRVQMWSGRPRTRGLIPWLMSGPSETGGATKIRARSCCGSHTFLPPGLDAESASVHRGKVLSVRGGSRRIISAFSCVFVQVH